MIASLNSRKIIYFLLVFFFINIKISKQINIFKISISSNETDLPILIIKSSDILGEKDIIPSLLSPILLINEDFKDESTVQYIYANFTINNKIENTSWVLQNLTMLKEYNVVAGNKRFGNPLENCYLGLSSKNWTFLNNSQILLNRLKEKDKSFQRIFSFDKWFIDKKNKLIITSLIIGDVNDHFKLNNTDINGIIGECQVDKDYYYWGCPFTDMQFNNNITNLKKENSTEYYKIYFSSEEYIIRFPISFNKTFHNITGGKCKNLTDIVDSIDYLLTCDNFFNEEGYAKLTLISKNMNITIQIDNKKRFSKGEDDKFTKSRIKFENIDDFILPLIMFKEFDIQFDAENDKIKFYTTDKSILQVKKEKEKEKEKKSSNAGTIILIIFIIILILVLGFGVFWLIKNRRGSVEKNINKYNKFDEDENFQKMNEQRVF